MIEVKGLTKIYGNHKAVDDLTFTLKPGEIYGFLGPNGAGKSTTMNMITGCLAATSGEVKIGGHDIFKDPLAAKRKIGYLPEQPPLYLDMTPAEYLRFVGEAKGLRHAELTKEVRSVLSQTGLTEMKDRLIAHLSKGYRQRVGIAQAILGKPEIVILDEPTVGLDPQQIIEIRNLIKELGKKRTVILSSHILSEISAVCSHVLILYGGRLVANDSMKALEGTLSPVSYLTLRVRTSRVADPTSALEEIFAAFPWLSVCEISQAEGAYICKLSAKQFPDARCEEISMALASGGFAVVQMTVSEPGLENIYLTLTGGDGGQTIVADPSADSQTTVPTEREEGTT